VARALVKQGINPAPNRQLEPVKRQPENAATFDANSLRARALKSLVTIAAGGLPP